MHPARVRLAIMDAVNLRERSDWSDAVAATIRAERAALSLTQSDVIARSGLARSTYIRIETGQRVPDVTQLARIAEALGMRLVELAEARAAASGVA